MDLPSFLSDIISRFAINIISCLLIVYLIYFKRYSRKNYAFAYMLISTTVFFLCYFLATVEFQLGLALGLFAIFGIIRYRTDSVPIKEMTYLFLVIALSIINALVSLENRILEIALTNIVLVAMPYIIERFGDDNMEKLVITYDKTEFLHKDKKEELENDLKERLGIKVKEIRIEKIDFSSNKAKLELKVEKKREL